MKCLIFVVLASVAFAKTTAETKNPKPDNTAVNTRDNKNLTADEQSYGSAHDQELTRLIRRDITNDKALSTYAHNIKIITLGGQVFLRGPVTSQEEKDRIQVYAEKTVGANNIKNELEVVQK